MDVPSILTCWPHSQTRLYVWFIHTVCNSQQLCHCLLYYNLHVQQISSRPACNRLSVTVVFCFSNSFNFATRRFINTHPSPNSMSLLPLSPINQSLKLHHTQNPKQTNHPTPNIVSYIIPSYTLYYTCAYNLGHAETAHNRIASVVVGFKEALLEEAEKKKDTRK